MKSVHFPPDDKLEEIIVVNKINYPDIPYVKLSEKNTSLKNKSSIKFIFFFIILCISVFILYRVLT